MSKFTHWPLPPDHPIFKRPLVVTTLPPAAIEFVRKKCLAGEMMAKGAEVEVVPPNQSTFQSPPEE
jgi:hypothetical protein